MQFTHDPIVPTSVCISCKRWMDNYSLLRLQTICLVSRGDPQGEPTPHSGLLELGGISI